MARVKVIRTELNENLNGEYFNDTPSNTIFDFGKFFVTTNFDNKETIDYTDSLSSFVRPVTLESMDVSDTQSEIIQDYTTNAVLNLNKSDLNTYVRYGSAYEFLRTSIQNIILAYPGSLFANSQKEVGGVPTFSGLTYDVVSNISTFYVYTGSTVNTFGLVYNDGNDSIPDDNELKNLNLSYDKYVIWSNLKPETLYPVVGYTGNTINHSDALKRDYLRLEVEGNPFSLLDNPTGLTYQDFHIRPNNVTFEEFRAQLDNYEQNLISKRDGTDGFIFTLKNPTQLEDGKIIYSDSQILWSTSDGYNIDVDTPTYQRFLEIVLTIGEKYDSIKTDLIARFLTPDSLKLYDYTEEGKITKLLRLYGREFDQIRQFIDSLVNINKVTYNKQNNIPDQLIKNMANTFGWDYFSLVNEKELVEGFLTVDDSERDLNEDILPAEIDIELWRRIINNTSYFWKSKGTRQAIKSMFLLIGIPEPFINITEYVYTVDGKIDPNTVPYVQADFPSNSLPYDTEGYPIAPLETSDFYFQVSGNSDSGQDYLNVFRQAGFNLKQTPDNKKSWEQSGATTRIHPTTPQYYQEDSKLVINTKEVDVSLDTARGIEYDVYEYIQKDFAANSSGYTLPYSYVNISNVNPLGNGTFELPTSVNYKLGDIEVRYNGILLNAPKTGTTTGITTQADYSVNGNTFTIPELSAGTRTTDIIQVTLVDSGTTSVAGPTTGITIEYIVTRVKADLNGTYVPLPSYPHGDVQLTINGIALTKGTPQFVADYILDPANSSASGATNQIIIQNPDVIAYLNANPDVQISYMHVQGSNDINLRSEVIRIDSFNSSKIYFNNSANKYVYKLNYKVNNASEVKFLIDGVALEPMTDYDINVQNPYEIFLPRGLRFGSVISAYYLVGGAGAFNPVINDAFGLGDISELSFLEFLELVQRKMVNVRTRKVVTDFKGGWYPTILKLYETYLERALLPDGDPLQSNGYTFENLYPFLSKYNAFFQRFIDQLLSTTIILRRGGLLIRNSIFTKQKHWYKRGVNVANGTSQYDLRGNELLQYFGTDDTTFSIIQETPPPPPPPTQFYVETTPGVLGSLTTGGRNIVGFDELTEYGVDYKILNPPSYPFGTSAPLGLENLLEGIDYDVEELGNDWTRISLDEPLTVNNFSLTITDLMDDTDYQYRAFVSSPSSGFTGNTLLVHTPPPPIPDPSINTIAGTGAGNIVKGGAWRGKITGTGGDGIIRFDEVQNYAVQYRAVGSGSWLYRPNPPASGPLAVNYYNYDIYNLEPDTDYEYRAYMTVDGLAYYGDTLTAHTLPEPDRTYTVGTATNLVKHPDGTGFDATDNTFSDGVPDNVLRYGIVYTQSGKIGTDDNLKITNSLAKKTYLPNPSTASSPFSVTATGLNPSTFTYYRAFVENGDSESIAGVGYGSIRTLTTLIPPPSEFSINLEIVGLGGLISGTVKVFDSNGEVDSDTFDGTRGIEFTSFSVPIGETYRVSMSTLNLEVSGVSVRSNDYYFLNGDSGSPVYSPLVSNITENVNITYTMEHLDPH